MLQGSGGNTISGNFLGDDPSGGPLLGNAGDGLLIDGSLNNLINGNVISGNGGNGVELEGSGSSGDTIEGNFIGTNPSGTGSVPNTDDGVLIDQVRLTTTWSAATAAPPTMVRPRAI